MLIVTVAEYRKNPTACAYHRAHGPAHSSRRSSRCWPSRPPEIPTGDGWIYEPKWDGFRAARLPRRRRSVFIQSRDLKPLNRYFPELEAPLLALGGADARFVLDGEVVIARPDGGLDFDSLLIRIHPAASRVQDAGRGRRRRRSSPSTAWPRATTTFATAPSPSAGLGSSGWPAIRRNRSVSPRPRPIRRSPATGSTSSRAPGWTAWSPSAPIDPYAPGKRTMAKIKHERTADCVVAGFRWHKNGPGTLVGSLLLGLWNDEGQLQHVGVTSSFTMAKRAELVEFLEPYRTRRDGRSPLARVGARRGRRGRAGPPHAGRHLALEPRQGPVAGSRSGPSSCARSPSTISRAIASATRRRSGAGGPTARRPTAATTSSRRRRRPCWPTSSG